MRLLRAHHEGNANRSVLHTAQRLWLQLETACSTSYYKSPLSHSLFSCATSKLTSNTALQNTPDKRPIKIASQLHTGAATAASAPPSSRIASREVQPTRQPFGHVGSSLGRGASSPYDHWHSWVSKLGMTRSGSPVSEGHGRHRLFEARISVEEGERSHWACICRSCEAA
mgnify:CR=1 FL=1